MGIRFESRDEAADRLNSLQEGRSWTARDMGLYDVHFTGWPEGAVPVRIWLPVRDIVPREMAALLLGVSPMAIRHVERLTPAAEANVELSAAASDWRPYDQSAGRLSAAAGAGE